MTRNITRTVAHSLVAVTIAFGLTNAASAQPAVPSDEALRAFEVVRSVLQHPRCQNCHIPGDAPLQGDESVTHTQFVKRGPAGLGATAMECAVCHQAQNLPASYGLHVPPGAPHWRLPPPEFKMVFIGLSWRDYARPLKTVALREGATSPPCWRTSVTTNSLHGAGRLANSVQHPQLPAQRPSRPSRHGWTRARPARCSRICQENAMARAPLKLHLKKNKLHKDLGKAPGAKLTAADIAKEKAKGGVYAKRAQFAENARKWKHTGNTKSQHKQH